MAFAFYNRWAAIHHAKTFALSRDLNFADYSYSTGHGDGDCTNFLSQNLYMGGWPMLEANVSNFIISLYGGTWWAKPPARLNSKSWASASHFIDFLERTNRAAPCKLGDVSPGDVITHQDSSHGNHVMLVTGLDIDGPLRVPLLTYHTTDRLDYPFGEVMKGFGVEGYKYWKLKDFFDAS
jgi:hypothetical protein